MRIVVYSMLFAVAALGGAWGPASVSLRPQATAQTTPRATPVPAATPPNKEQTEIITTREVRLQVSVLDKKEQPVSGLTKQDFQVFEDKQPQVIESFSDEHARLPIYVGVLMDTSSSTAGKLKFEQEAAMNFIHTVVRLRKDKVAFVTFDHEVNLRQDFTDKLDLLDRAVYSVKKPGTNTALYDAVWQFCDEKLRNIGAGNRVMVVITDGDDTYSRAALRDAIDIAQRTETKIFAISTKAGFSGSVPGVEAGQVKDRGDRDLTKLCEETGGKAFFSGDFLELERSFMKIAKELRAQYLVTYKPTNNVFDGTFRQIEVKIAPGHKGLKVRTKRGYTAVNDTVK